MMGAKAVLKSGKLGIAGLALWTVLAGCERDVVLEGERFPVRADLAASIPVEGQPLPIAPPDRPENLSVPISLPAAQTLSDWTHRGGNMRHSSPHGTFSAVPQRVWTVNIGAGNSRRNRISASPVIDGGRVFAMDSGSTVVATTTGGATLWQTSLTPEFDRGGEVSGGGLAASGNRIFATTGFGELVALDGATGAIIWRQRAEAPVIGSPAVDGDAVYAVSRDGAAMAVSTDTGRILWQVPGARTSNGMIGAAAPAITETSVLFPFASGQISAVDRQGGALIWTGAVAGQRVGRAYAAVGDITGDPVVVDGVVYAGSAAGRTVAIAADTGLRIWTTNEGALNPPLVVGGSVFVVNDEARLVRMDAASGDVIWSVQMPYFAKDKAKKRKAIFAHYGPVLAGGRIVVASSDGTLRLFDPTDGSAQGQVDIPGGAASAPALAGGMLFVVSGNGQLHAFR